jgi:hypothetical protein
MPTARARATPRPAEGSTDQRLARALDNAPLDRIVPRLAPETLHQIVLRHGLRYSADVLLAATPAQLDTLADLDLWQQVPGGDSQFDVNRFGEWLETLADADERGAARTLASLDPDVAIAGLSTYIRVFDPGVFEPIEQSDDEAPDRHLMMTSEGPSAGPECELGGYLVRARRSDTWDAIVSLLATLDAEYPDAFHVLMRGCRRLSNTIPEVDGLDDLLQTPDQHAYDVARERDARRSHRGYAATADARAFLSMARLGRPVASMPVEGDANARAANPIAAAYFRNLADMNAEETKKARRSGTAQLNRSTAESTADDGRLDEAEAEILAALVGDTGKPTGLLGSGQAPAAAGRYPALQRLLSALDARDRECYARRMSEFAFLANVLQAGLSIQSRPLTPEEAADAAGSTCNLGLECWPGAVDDDLLVRQSLIEVFETGWSVLHHDVSLFAAERLEAALDTLTGPDVVTAAGIRRLRRELSRERKAGSPWLARDATDVLAALDTTAWAAVRGLLEECPVVPAALRAILEHSARAVSPTAFEFISTAGQLGDIRVFMRMLPQVLAG